MPDRRSLDFQSMEQILPEVECLLQGHQTTGQWTLAQILYHLATAIRLSSSGHFRRPAGPGVAALKQRFFSTRKFRDGAPVPVPALMPPADAELEHQAEALRTAIAGFRDADGPFPDHPILGALTRDDWCTFHCIHAAHHLSYAMPSPETAERQV